MGRERSMCEVNRMRLSANLGSHEDDSLLESGNSYLASSFVVENYIARQSVSNTELLLAICSGRGGWLFSLLCVTGSGLALLSTLIWLGLGLVILWLRSCLALCGGRRIFCCVLLGFDVLRASLGICLGFGDLGSDSAGHASFCWFC